MQEAFYSMKLIYSNFSFPFLIPIFFTLGIFIASLLIRPLFSKGKYQQQATMLQNFVTKVTLLPLIFFSVSFFILFLSQWLINYIPHRWIMVLALSTTYLLKMLSFITLFWLLLNFIHEGKLFLFKWAQEKNYTIIFLILQPIASSIAALIILLMLTVMTPEFGLQGAPEITVAKISKVIMIAIFGYILIQVCNVLESLIINQYSSHADAIQARKINTQVIMLKKVIYSIIILLTAASILMVFDSVRNLGAGILTTAGIVSAVGAFAGQQSLARIFAGIQIAFTQPIRIGDTVIIENEFGTVEEISLSHIVIKLWDLRRLILPSDYLSNKGLQNLTRNSSDLLGTIFIYSDYTLPIHKIREKFEELLNASPLWNKKASALQVTDIKNNTMEIRALVSANDASSLWDLRCDIREKLIAFLVSEYPECLPLQRNKAITDLALDKKDKIENH